MLNGEKIEYINYIRVNLKTGKKSLPLKKLLYGRCFGFVKEIVPINIKTAVQRDNHNNDNNEKE